MARQYKRRLDDQFVLYYDLVDYDETFFYEEELVSGKPVVAKTEVERQFDANVVLWGEGEQPKDWDSNEPGAYVDLHQVPGRVERVDQKHVKYFLDLQPGKKQVVGLQRDLQAAQGGAGAERREEAGAAVGRYLDTRRSPAKLEGASAPGASLKRRIIDAKVCQCGWREAAISAENFAMNVPYNRVVLLLAIVVAVTPILATDTELAIEAIKRGDACGDKSDLVPPYPRTPMQSALIPTNATARYKRGVTYQLMRELRKAIDDYSEAIRLDPRARAPIQPRGVLRTDGRLRQGDRRT